MKLAILVFLYCGEFVKALLILSDFNQKGKEIDLSGRLLVLAFFLNRAELSVKSGYLIKH